MRRPLLPVVLIAASVTIATVSLPGGTAAQGIVKVVDARGIGIPAVRIELYGRAELLGTASTDPDGWADLTTRRWTELRRVTLRHLGYQTLVIAADQLDISRPISLHDAALSLDGLDVEVSGELCPTDDDPAGRALWQDAARRYSPDTGTRALHASYL